MATPEILKTIIDINGRISPSLKRSLNKAGSMMSKVATASRVAFGGAMTFGIKAIIDSANQYNDSVREMIRGTGAQGKALADLKSTLVATSGLFSGDQKSVAMAIADASTYLDLSGDSLRAYMATMAKFTDIAGGDLQQNVRSSVALFQKWGIATEDFEPQLQKMNTIIQASGLSFGEMMQQMKEYSPILKQMGYSATSASMLLGKLNKKGADVAKITAGFRKLASAGIQLDEAIGYISSATNEQDKLARSVEIFGPEIATHYVEAIDKGFLSLEDFQKAVESNNMSLEEQQKQLLKTTDQFTRFKNGLLADIGSRVAEGANIALGALNDLWDQSGKDFGKFIDNLWTQLKEVVPAFIRFIASSLGDVFGIKEFSFEGFKQAGLGALDKLAKSIIADRESMPMKANGGFVSQPSICGEAGTEAVISFNKAHRNENIRYWQEAGRRLGMNATYDLSGMVFSPSIVANDSTNIIDELRSNEKEFAMMVADAVASNACRMH